MVKIDKDVVAFIRKKIPTACIYRTVKNKSKRGIFYVEETDNVLQLISQYYKNNEKVIFEYPVC